MEIRKLISDNEIEEALNLALSVFDTCNGASYSQAGVESFHACLMLFRIFPILAYWGCFDEGRLVGMLGNNGTQITLLFVNPAYQGKGIGRLLVQPHFSSVKAFPGSVQFYEKCGFQAISEPLEEDGIEYVMMERM
ncbi:MAG: GNAT family N-acetyltransferase [Clostridia bacterium]|nr:GNAT family N-acetyltransferase [Clostridia bacterium]